MSARVLDGKRVRDEILNGLRPRIQALQRPPGLAVVLVGNDPASEIYVRNKVKACHDLGIYSEKLALPDEISTDELLGVVDGLNAREEIDGILVQVPLPAQVDRRQVLLRIRPDKDVDGFHPCNIGNLALNNPGLRACTPSGIIEMLARYEIPVAGARAVVVGRSDIVGKPLALLLLHRNATVTICHSGTVNLAEECRRADILVAAMGRPGFIGEGFIQPGATVIDVGTTRVNGKLSGDVDAEYVQQVAGAYTPVPGGVGPLTIAMLMSNTVQAASHHQCSG